MTPRQMIAALKALPKDARDLPLIAVHGASGDTNRVGNPSVQEKDENDDCGEVCTFADDTRYVQIYIGN